MIAPFRVRGGAARADASTVRRDPYVPLWGRNSATTARCSRLPLVRTTLLPTLGTWLGQTGCVDGAGTLSIRVLGPLEVCAAGETIDIRAGLPPVLLDALLVRH